MTIMQKNSFSGNFRPFSGRPRVLLHVEDDDATAYLFQLGLEQAGIDARYFRTTTGNDAIDFVRGRGIYGEEPAPDLIILDINLQGTDGFETLRKLRAVCLEYVPIVVLSSSDNPDDRKRAFALGASDYLVKGGGREECEQAARAIYARSTMPNGSLDRSSGILRVHAEMITAEADGKPTNIARRSTKSQVGH